MIDKLKQIKIISSEGGLFAIYEGVYYKLNQRSYEVLELLLNGTPVDHIMETYHIDETDINNLLSSFKRKKNIRRIQQIVKLIPASINNLCGKFFQFLHKNNIVISAVICVFAISSIYNINHYHFALISSGVTIVHYFIIVFFISLWHEFGHLSAAYLRGVKDLEMYLGIFYIFPTMYVNLDTLNILPKQKRILVDIGGLYFQCILGIILFGILLFCPSPILQMAVNINFCLVIYNVIPLLVTDGYWLYSDFFEIDNLNSKAATIMKNCFHLKKTIVERKKIPTIIYTIWRSCIILLLYVYIFSLLYRTSYYFSDLYYQLLESRFHPIVICKALLLITPYIFLLIYIIKKIKNGLSNNKERTR